ncbi:hypothetical protein ACLRGF_10655 [Mycetocola zhadangensis]|uniref:hypothetical protein n=1 Tax=Mycetocola zhadangensis TaxID=1164595 RepID=UPI003A4E54DC
MEFGVRTQKRMLRRALAVSATLLVVAASVACTTPAPKPTPTPTAIFASEDEALAAATDTYEKYTAAFDEANSRGGSDMSSLESYVTPEHLADLNQPGRLEENGWHTSGVSTFHVVGLDSVLDDGALVELGLNLCRDISEVRVLSADGTDVTPADRLNVLPLTVHFVSHETSPERLIVSEIESWLDNPAC